MKSRLLNAGLLGFALLMMLSACSSDETLTGDSNASVKSMKINVSDGAFTSVDNSALKTRATDNGTATSFGNGDVIGIFAVMPNGTLALTNAKYTYDGTSKWLNSDNTENLPYFAGAKYFAYYPYQENMGGKYLSNGTFSNLTAETFFGILINCWTPAADQSTQTKYTAQDLMVSMATVDASTYSSSFTMSHQMSMVEMDFHQVHYTYNGADTYHFTFDTAKPFNIADGKYRFLVHPSNALSITGNNQYNSTDVAKIKVWKITGAAPASAKYKIYKYNGASACLTETPRQNVYIGDVNIGDYLYADGTSGTEFKSGSTVGIIFSNELTPAQYNAGCRHGKVLALKNANSGNPCYWASNNNSPYTDHTYTGHPYLEIFKTCFDDINSGYDALSANSSYVNTPSNYAWYNCKNYSDGINKSFTNSDWYLPSIGEWWNIVENLGTWTDDQMAAIKGMRTIFTSSNGQYLIQNLKPTYFSDLNKKLAAASGDMIIFDQYDMEYWSASEHDSILAYTVGFSSSMVLLSTIRKDQNVIMNNVCVRSILAY